MSQENMSSTLQSRRAGHPLLAINSPFELDGVGLGTCEGNIEGDGLTLKASRKRVGLSVLLECAGDLVRMLLQIKNCTDGSKAHVPRNTPFPCNLDGLELGTLWRWRLINWRLITGTCLPASSEQCSESEQRGENRFNPSALVHK